MKRQALGKGLRSLIPEKPAASPSVRPSAFESPPAASGLGYRLLDLDRIDPNRDQPRRRFDPAPLEELAQSMKDQGVLQPVVVRPQGDRFQLIAGERRWRAAQMAGLLKIPAIVREVGDMHVLELALVENLQREELNPIDAAHAFQVLIDDLGLTQNDVASRVGKQRTTVTNLLRLLTLPAAVQDKVRTGQISTGHAKALAALGSPSLQIEIAERILKEGLSVRQVELLAGRAGKDDGRAGSGARVATPADANVRAAEQHLQRAVGTRVRIVQGKGGGGRIELHFFSHEEMERVYQRLIRAGGE